MKRVSSKHIMLSSIILTVFLTAFAVNTKVYAVTPNACSIELNKKNISLKAGKSYTFEVTLTGGSGPVKWSSSNKSVATVKNGTVTAKKAGSATIKVKYSGKTAQCKITVKTLPKKAEALKAYKAFLGKKQKYKGYFRKGARFYVSDINLDGIPELLLLTTEYKDFLDLDLYAIVLVFSYVNEKVVYLGHLGEECYEGCAVAFLRSKQGLIFHLTDFGESGTCYSFNGRKMKEYASWGEDEKGKQYYKINERKVSREAFVSKIKPFLGKSMVNVRPELDGPVGHISPEQISESWGISKEFHVKEKEAYLNSNKNREKYLK